MVTPLGLFPTELLIRICDFVEDPEDWISFSLLNRRFQAIAEPYKKYHHGEWSKYAVLQDRPNTRHWFWHNILHSVLKGWDGAKYVRTIKVIHADDSTVWDLADPTLEPLVHDWDSSECREVTQPNPRSFRDYIWTLRNMEWVSRNVEIEHRLLLVRALKDLDWITCEGSTHWCPTFRHVSLVIALLAWFLPNLRTLVLARFPSSHLRYLHRVASHAARNISVLGDRYGPLSRLSKVDFIGKEIRDDTDLENVADSGLIFEPSFLLPFLSLPSVRSLRVAHVVGEMERRTEGLTPSMLTDLNLQFVNIPPDAFSTILEGSTNLRCCELTMITTSATFNVVAAIEALQKNAGDTLEELTLRTHPINTPVSQSTSFAAFGALVKLNITYDCLCARHSVDLIVNLPDILPSSLKKLSIHSHQFRQRLVPDILALLDQNPPEISELECLSVKGWLSDEDKRSIKQACYQRSIRCEGDLATDMVGQSKTNILVVPPVGRAHLLGLGNPATRLGLSLHTFLGT